jgi:hypothetical protein
MPDLLTITDEMELDGVGWDGMMRWGITGSYAGREINSPGLLFLVFSSLISFRLSFLLLLN